jgi:MFS family permease
MESFGIPKNDIARWAGITSAMLPICQACTGLIWGTASDKYGRKPIILLGLFNTMCSMLMLGMSTSLPMALAARALEGLGNGNVGVLRTTVAELCPWRELQPRAFSIMPLVYTVGAVIGPTLGGALANPLRVDPRKPRGHAFLEHFPYILPNIIAAVIFTMGIIVGWLFLQETLETKRHSPDLGIRTGRILIAFVRRTLGRGGKNERTGAEHEPLLKRQKVANEEREQSQRATSKKDSPRIWDVLTFQTSLILVIYTLLAFFTLAFDQVGAPADSFVHH